jgi:hypothetical protein
MQQQIVDTIPQIRLFVKLKLTNHAPPGNRAGLFRARLSVGWVEHLCETHRFTSQQTQPVGYAPLGAQSCVNRHWRR